MSLFLHWVDRALLAGCGSIIPPRRVLRTAAPLAALERTVFYKRLHLYGKVDRRIIEQLWRTTRRDRQL